MPRQEILLPETPSTIRHVHGPVQEHRLVTESQSHDSVTQTAGVAGDAVRVECIGAAPAPQPIRLRIKLPSDPLDNLGR